MPKIDVSKIDGYDTMTAEQKIAALEGYDMVFDTTGFVKKDVYDKVNADLASTKKALKAKQTDEEAKAEAEQAMKAELEALRKESKVSKFTAKLISSGYDESDALEAANAYYDGDTDKFFELQQKNIEAVRRSAAAQSMKDTPPPQNGNHEDGTTDYSKKIAEAQARGDYVAVAYLMRRQAEENNKE